MLVLCVLQRELNGHNYFEFEYTAKTPRYTRHSLAVVVANDGEGKPAPATIVVSCCCPEVALRRTPLRLC